MEWNLLEPEIRPVVVQNLGQVRGNGVNTTRYIDQVLRPSTARVTRDFLQQNNITIMPWSAFIPDLNPIDTLRNEILKH